MESEWLIPRLTGRDFGSRWPECGCGHDLEPHVVRTLFLGPGREPICSAGDSQTAHAESSGRLAPDDGDLETGLLVPTITRRPAVVRHSILRQSLLASANMAPVRSSRVGFARDAAAPQGRARAPHAASDPPEGRVP